MDMQSQHARAGEALGGRYELVGSIGKGSAAEVWRATDLVASRAVAVKFLRPDTEDLRQLDTQEALAELDVLRGRFRREGTLLGRLGHPGIPELYDQGSYRGMPYLVMQLVEGVALHKFLDRYRPLALPTAAAIAAQVADALACAHTLPVVHRDLKPQNVMLSNDGVAVLLDFGIAKPLGVGVTSYTRHGSTLGSRGYQAPEQILEKEPTTRTDIYSFGCVCYELFTGNPPFIADEAKSLIEQHLETDPLPPSVHATRIPEELSDTVLRMLAKAPERRPDIGEVRALLLSLAPAPGDPEPRPRLVPDPTRPFRVPDEAPDDPRTTPARTQVPTTDDEWLDMEVVERLCDEAQGEIDSGEPGAAVRRLAELAERAKEEWGTRRPLVRRVWHLAADGLRLAGDCGGAAQFYQVAADDLVRGEAPEDQAERAELRLRAAECRLAFGEITAAVATLEEAGRVAASLPHPLAAKVAKVRREVEVDIDERTTNLRHVLPAQDTKDV